MIPDFNLDQSFTESTGDFSTETLTDEGHFCYATYIFALKMIEISHHRRYSQDSAAIEILYTNLYQRIKKHSILHENSGR